MIVAVAAALFLFPMRSVSVQFTNTPYNTAEEVIAASGLKKGQSIFFVGGGGVDGAVRKKLPYVRSVAVQKSYFPPHITLKITDVQVFGQVKCAQGYAVLDTSLRVLGVEPSARGDCALITGVTADSAAPGDAVKLADAASQAALRGLGAALARRPVAGITEVDVRQATQLVLTLPGPLYVKLGGTGDLDYKLETLNMMLTEKGLAGKAGVFDASFLSETNGKSYFREGETLSSSSAASGAASSPGE